MSVSKEMEEITSTFDISITKNDIKKKFVGEIKNKLVHFFIKKGIIKQEALYIYIVPVENILTINKIIIKIILYVVIIVK